jgi:carbonic anhydrase/acetyltransferase-like protein (isoleucine patch superfamily)
MIYSYKDCRPKCEQAAFIAPSADIIGDVNIEEGSSVWFNTTIRADLAPVSIGRNTNIQDNCIVHADPGQPVIIGDNVTVGHGAIVHGCRIGSESLIGMGAIVLNGAVIESNCIIGAGAVVTENKRYPSGSVIVGNPAKPVRDASKVHLKIILHSAQSNAKKAMEMAKAVAPERGTET